MSPDVRRYNDPQTVLDAVEPFLALEPILNNLLLTILTAEALRPQPGRYWVACEGGQTVGMAMQSTLDRSILLSTMPQAVAAAMGNTIGRQNEDPSGVLGEARPAARFAAEWSQCRGTGALPVAAQRIYEARAVRHGPAATGQMECATTADFARVRDWNAAFMSEIGEPAELASQFAERTVAARQVWLWNDRG